MDGLDAQSLISLRLMVRQLEIVGIVPSVLNALARVPRHRFVERFWSTPQETLDVSSIREWDLRRDDPAQVAALLHDVNRALAVHESFDWGEARSTLSAPAVVASLLQHLDLAPGMRVLEIGTGTGYTTALLAELTGEPDLVTSIEIDPSLTDAVRGRLDDLGYGAVHTVVGDGDYGVADRAPYDRILATVGCEDLSPAWSEQLRSDGLIVAPVSRGLEHPLVVARPTSSGFMSRAVDRAVFVRIRGAQAGSRSVPVATPAPRERHELRSLPSELSAQLTGDTPEALAAQWGLEFYLSLRAPASDPNVLTDPDGSSAVLRARAGTLATNGPSASRCAGELLARITDWAELGSPTPRDYVATWGSSESTSVGGRSGPWACERIHHVEENELDWGALDA